MSQALSSLIGDMTPTLTSLTLFALWTLVLTLMIALTRIVIVQTGKKKANEFQASGEDIGGFSLRLARAHANCCENLPIVGAIFLAAILSGNGGTSDDWAMYILYARVAQSVVHLLSTSVPAVLVRFGFYLVQWALLVLIGVSILI